MSVGNSRRTSTKSSRSAATRAASSCCSSASTPSFSSPGSSPRSTSVSWSTSCSVISSVSPLGLVATMRVVALHDRARRAHPVERLVRLRVGVDRDRAVGLQQHEANPGREARAEPALVGDRTTRDEQPHRRSLARGAMRPTPGAAGRRLAPVRRPVRSADGRAAPSDSVRGRRCSARSVLARDARCRAVDAPRSGRGAGPRGAHAGRRARELVGDLRVHPHARRRARAAPADAGGARARRCTCSARARR